MIQELEASPANRVFYYFIKICSIPHGSGNTKAVSDFCAAFAREHSLEYWQDALNNIVIVREAASGFETRDPVIIQGHLDMVCEKESWREIDFDTEGLELIVEGDFLKARGTTLGADDGIAVACALALLEKENLHAPKIEAVFTVEEETGMDGARNIDLRMLKGRTMLNLDSEEEGIFLCGCAGGTRMDSEFSFQRVCAEGIACRVSVGGLSGGHSGTEIGKGHANAIVLLGRMLQFLRQHTSFALISLHGGNKDNAIPREASASLLLTEDPGSDPELLLMQIREALSGFQNSLRKEFHVQEPDLTLAVSFSGDSQAENSAVEESEAVLPSFYEVIPEKEAFNIESFLFLMPNEMQNMSADIPGLVETSLNAGILQTIDDSKETTSCDAGRPCTRGTVSVTFSLRSSASAKMELLSRKLCLLTEVLGGTCTTQSAYPAWEYQADSKLRRRMVSLYRDLFGEEPKIEVIHAGLECGLFQEKINDLDCVSFGPQIYDIHTPKERLSISSTERIWKFLLALLEG